MTKYIKHNDHVFYMPGKFFLVNERVPLCNIVCKICGSLATVYRGDSKGMKNNERILTELKEFGLFILWPPDKECSEKMLDNII